jgi:hypothetical protein
VLTTEEAFAKFRSRQELTPGEQTDVSDRQKRIRRVVEAGIGVEEDFLSGSYARWTKTRPLQDVDVFCVLSAAEQPYRRRHPSAVLERLHEILVPTYGRDRVTIDRMAVTVDFGVTVDEDEETHGKVMSIDVVPAFIKGDHYEIPDAMLGRWIETNPNIHAEMAVAAHRAYQDEWKPLVRMIKKWNRTCGKLVTPSFLLEVMALDLLVPPFSGGYPYELKGFFASAAERIGDRWPDPVGLGPNVSSAMSAPQIEAACWALRNAEATATRGILLERRDNQGEALRTWRSLFGPQFPLS